MKIRVRDLNEMRDVVGNKIGKITHIRRTELMTVLKTKKEEQTVSFGSVANRYYETFERF